MQCYVQPQAFGRKARGFLGISPFTTGPGGWRMSMEGASPLVSQPQVRGKVQAWKLRLKSGRTVWVSTAEETMIVDSGLRLETRSVARQGFLVLLKTF